MEKDKYFVLLSCWPEREIGRKVARMKTDNPIGKNCPICGRVIRQNDGLHFWWLCQLL